MTKLGGLIKKLPDGQAALVAVGLLCLSCFSGGAAFNHYTATFQDIPSRVFVLEKTVLADSLSTVEWRAESEARLAEWFVMWEAWSRVDSIFKWESTCVDRMQIEGKEIGRYDCQHGTGDAHE